MALNMESLGPVATLIAFVFSTIVAAYVKIKMDKTDDTSEVNKKVEQAVKLDKAVELLARRLSVVEDDNERLSLENSKIIEENKRIKARLEEMEEMEEIVKERYPLTLRALKNMRDENPNTKVTIPQQIIDDFKSL